MKYPVANLLGQASPPNRISVGDFDAFHQAALSAIGEVASIARAHGLSDDEEKQVQTAIRKIDGYTVAMTPCSSEIPWWAAGLVGLAAGGAIIYFAT
jgi:hypothetical protein